ncbi:fasciclin domain-containing protein [Aquisalibacillus elongatus]|uniref:Putative surface protein with fasciclin (FAS1) repeats n=1 Tax=Aquisalibacillus elongatus TaxID=485577 RepID=A0A3N5CFN2_9BACI|nr:fasciclin domain-containing protein [Aquisalibacillus elongatus]RPF56161.1 putative surface protein with fasciclin (FAS1) repeats [Aquisalibacillus elongatus]
MKWKWLILSILTIFVVSSFSLGALAEDQSATEKDIVETAVEAGDFTTLAAALEKAGLVETLKGEGPFTVFAPTDDAFEALLKELDITAEELLDREDLKDILLYHVVEGKVMSDSLEDGMKVKTLNGKKVKISLDPTQVNDANVILADVEASNGVIHVIDKVLLPKK